MKAVFLDRDGTLIDDPGFLGDPALVRLLPGVAEAVVRLERLGFLRIVITNQSGIGRGLLSEQQLAAVHREIERQLALAGASIDGWYHCPHLPTDGCDCRKPGTALHRRAAAEFGVDLGSSWCIGDRPGDVDAALPLGAGAILVETGEGTRHSVAIRGRGIAVVADLSAATDLIESGTQEPGSDYLVGL